MDFSTRHNQAIMKTIVRSIQWLPMAESKFRQATSRSVLQIFKYLTSVLFTYSVPVSQKPSSFNSLTPHLYLPSSSSICLLVLRTFLYESLPLLLQILLSKVVRRLTLRESFWAAGSLEPISVYSWDRCFWQFSVRDRSFLSSRRLWAVGIYFRVGISELRAICGRHLRIQTWALKGAIPQSATRNDERILSKSSCFLSLPCRNAIVLP